MIFHRVNCISERNRFIIMHTILQSCNVEVNVFQSAVIIICNKKRLWDSLRPRIVHRMRFCISIRIVKTESFDGRNFCGLLCKIQQEIAPRWVFTQISPRGLDRTLSLFVYFQYWRAIKLIYATDSNVPTSSTHKSCTLFFSIVLHQMWSKY